MNMQDFLDYHILGFAIEKFLLIFIKAVLIYAVTQTGVWIVKFLFRRADRRVNRVLLSKTTAAYILRIIVYTIYTVGGAVFLSLIPGMEKIGNSILAGAGIMAMAVGFASKEVLSNFISGLFIVFGKPFRIGDSIKINDMIIGTVSEITLRHTVLLNAENRTIIVPNSTMNASTILNSTIGEQSKCSFVEIAVTHNTDLEKAIEVMREEIMKHPLLIDHRTPKEKRSNQPQVLIRVVEITDFSITLKAWAWAGNTDNAFVLKCDSLKSVKERFDKEGIEIPCLTGKVFAKNN